MAEQMQADQLELTYSNYVRIRDVALKTCQKRWTIGKSDKKGSGISVLAARHDDDEIGCHTDSKEHGTPVYLFITMEEVFDSCLSLGH